MLWYKFANGPEFAQTRRSSCRRRPTRTLGNFYVAHKFRLSTTGDFLNSNLSYGVARAPHTAGVALHTVRRLAQPALHRGVFIGCLLRRQERAWRPVALGGGGRLVRCRHGGSLLAW